MVADVISNLHALPSAVRQTDALLMSRPPRLSPDLLITFGQSVMSKNLKQLLRTYRPKAHWHIQPVGPAADTYQSLSRVIHADPTQFFQQMHAAALPIATTQLSYTQQWHERGVRARQQLNRLLCAEDASGEFKAVSSVLHHLPNGSNLHLANSNERSLC